MRSKASRFALTGGLGFRTSLFQLNKKGRYEKLSKHLFSGNSDAAHYSGIAADHHIRAWLWRKRCRTNRPNGCSEECCSGPRRFRGRIRVGRRLQNPEERRLYGRGGSESDDFAWG